MSALSFARLDIMALRECVSAFPEERLEPHALNPKPCYEAKHGASLAYRSGLWPLLGLADML